MDESQLGQDSDCSRSNRWHLGFALLIVAMGLPLRVMLLDQNFLDFDESMHFQAAKEPTLSETWSASREYTHPPLIFLLYHLWLPTGQSEWNLRLPSLAAGLMAQLAAYCWLRRVTGDRPALIGLFLITFAMPMILASIQMRGYTCFLLFIFLALNSYERLFSVARVNCDENAASKDRVSSGTEYSREPPGKRRMLANAVWLTVWLIMAIMTHYAAAWIILTLGVCGVLRITNGSISRRTGIAWVFGQCVILLVCVWLYISHVRSFVGGSIQTGLWDYWTSSRMLGLKPFLAQILGMVYPISLLLIPGGALVLAKRKLWQTGSYFCAVERMLLILFPFALAMVLLKCRMYPLSATRHSIWLLPFVALGLSAAAIPMLKRRRPALTVCMAVTCLAWAWYLPVRTLLAYETKQTPRLMQDTVKRLLSSIPEGSVILSDGSTCDVFDYYLAPKSINHGTDLGNGYVEYRMAGYRVISIPGFFFFDFDLSADWQHFEKTFGENAYKPLWVVVLGFDFPGNDADGLLRRLPPGRVVHRESEGDNTLLQIQFRRPEPHPSSPTGRVSTVLVDKK
ncbi:hypothetical protein GC176_06455 [bacterium]|nr:hypothetical protein [bacterium]